MIAAGTVPSKYWIANSLAYDSCEGFGSAGCFVFRRLFAQITAACCLATISLRGVGAAPTKACSREEGCGSQAAVLFCGRCFLRLKPYISRCGTNEFFLAGSSVFSFRCCKSVYFGFWVIDSIKFQSNFSTSEIEGWIFQGINLFPCCSCIFYVFLDFKSFCWVFLWSLLSGICYKISSKFEPNAIQFSIHFLEYEKL